MINHQLLDVKHDLTYEDTPMVILDRNIHGQRNSFNQGAMVKPWSGRVNLKKGRWDEKTKHPSLFTNLR